MLKARLLRNTLPQGTTIFSENKYDFVRCLYVYQHDTIICNICSVTIIISARNLLDEKSPATASREKKAQAMWTRRCTRTQKRQRWSKMIPNPPRFMDFWWISNETSLILNFDYGSGSGPMSQPSPSKHWVSATLVPQLLRFQLLGALLAGCWCLEPGAAWSSPIF